MKGFDLKGFHKISTDAKKTVMKHPDSDHQIIIAHSALSPKRRKELDAIPLKKFADGGDTESSFTKDASDAYQQVFGAPARPEEQSGIDFASRYNAPAADAKLHISPTERASMDAIKAKEGPVAGDNPAPQAEAAPVAAPAEIPGAAAPQDTLAQPERSPAAVPEAAAPAAQPSSAPPPGAPAGTEQFQQNYQKGFQAQKLENAEHYGREAAAFQQDLASGHITPETYQSLFAKKDTLGKIGTIFGLMVSGMGSGLTGQPNALLEMMNKEIKNDLEAQKQSKTNAQNFISLNMQQQLNEADIENKHKQGLLTDEQAKIAHAQAGIASNTLGHLQTNSSTLDYLRRSLDKMPEGPIKDNARAQYGLAAHAMNAENANVADLAAGQQALISSYGGGNGGSTMGLRMAGMDKMADNIDSRTIPGVGVSDLPVPQNKREELEAMNVLNYKAKDLLDFAKKHKGSLSPSDRAIGAQKAEEMMNYYNSSIKGGVLTEGRLKWLDQQIKKNPTSVFQDLLGNNSRLNEIMQSNEERKKIMLENAGAHVRGGDQGGGGSSEMVTVVSPSGQRGSIPKANLQKALGRGYKAAP